MPKEQIKGRFHTFFSPKVNALSLCTETWKKHERGVSERGWIQGLLMCSVCSVYGGSGVEVGGASVLSNDPFNVDLWRPARSDRELWAPAREQTLSRLSSFVGFVPQFLFPSCHVVVSIFFYVGISFWWSGFKNISFLSSGCPTTRSSGTHTTSSSSSMSSSWCTWSGRSFLRGEILVALFLRQSGNHFTAPLMHSVAASTSTSRSPDKSWFHMWMSANVWDPHWSSAKKAILLCTQYIPIQVNHTVFNSLY